MENPKLKIEIEAVDKATKTLQDASKSLRGLSSSFKQTARAAQEAERKQVSFFSALKTGTGKAGKYVDELNSRFRKLESSIFNLKTAVATALGGLTLGKIVKDGIDFNAQLQTAKLGLAALITSSYKIEDSQGRILSGMEAFKAAQSEAEKLYTEILNRAMQTASTSRELLQTFQSILPFAAHTGMSLQQTLNLSEALVNAAKAIGLMEGQAAQEGRDLFMGYVDQNDQLLRALGLSTEILKTWQQQGTLYKNVMGRLKYFVQASNEFADTWEGVTSSIKDLVSILEGSIFKGTFHVLNEELKKVRDYLLQLTKQPKKLEKISDELAVKFIDLSEDALKATEVVYKATEDAFDFGKKIYNFVNSNKDITEYGVIGYLLLGKKGALLGSIIGSITEVAKKSNEAFPTEQLMLREQPNAMSVLGIAGKPPKTLENAKEFEEAFREREIKELEKIFHVKNTREFEKVLQKYGNKPLSELPPKTLNELLSRLPTAKKLPISKPKEENLFEKGILELESMKHDLEDLANPNGDKGNKGNVHNIPNPNQNQNSGTLSESQPFEIAQNLVHGLSLVSPQPSLAERVYSGLNKQPLSSLSFGVSKNFKDYLSLQPNYSFDPVLFQIQTQQKKEAFNSQYLQFAKEYNPEFWKSEKLRELGIWYEEQKKVLGKSTELQELYEHKKLGIEKEAHEKEKKLYIEKLKQTSSWKAGVFKSLDDLLGKWSDTNQLVYDGTTQTFQALENSLETLFFDAMRGKLKSLGDYVNSFIASVESAIAGVAAKGVSSGIVNFAAKTFGFKTAANGDIFPGHFIPLKAFATGGVADRPTLGLIGEGRYPEAIVPLPDGKSIPVRFEGGKGQPVNLEIVIVDDRDKIPPPQIGKEQIVLTIAENIRNNGIIRKVIQSSR